MRLWRMVRVEKHYVSKGGGDCPRIAGVKMMPQHTILVLLFACIILAAYIFGEDNGIHPR
jgi:hypothetical protein